MSSRSLFFIALGLFGLYSVEFGVVGILPAIIERYGVTVAQAGALVGLFAMVVAVGGPFMVLWLSRYDRRIVLTGALLLFSVCSLLSAWAPNFSTLMALRVPSALMHPVFFSMAFAAAVSLYPPHRATHAMSMAFVGTSMGLVLGVPLTTWIEARVSYEASFYFCAVVGVIAATGIWTMLPKAATSQVRSPGQQLAILRKPAFLLSILSTVFVFGMMFSVYSYAAEYLRSEAKLGGEAISMLLVVFGVGGLLGNLLAGRWLARRRVMVAILHPVVLGGAYLVLYAFGSGTVSVMIPICLLWGAAHTSGLIVSQVWMTSSAPEAPEFATSLYVAAANLGVVAGASVGGVFISWSGLPGALWGGWLFAGLSFVCVGLKMWMFDRTGEKSGSLCVGLSDV